MKQQRWSIILLVSILALCLSAPVGGSEPDDLTPPQGAALSVELRAGISYQGVLREDGAPVSGSRDMSFRLYADDGCSMLVDTIDLSGVAVSDGLFSVTLGVDPADFNGQALWLQVQVDGTVLGCEEILPVPYALSLRPGARVHGTVAGGSTLHVENAAADEDAAAVVGRTTANYARNYGLWGETLSYRERSAGVYGRGDTNGTFGVLGESRSGIGIGGRSIGGFGRTMGVFGVTDSSANGSNGVSGRAVGKDGETAGVEGWNMGDGDGAAGVLAVADSTSGVIYGVRARTGSHTDEACGVSGKAYADSGKTYGVRGETASRTDRASGVFGHATGDSGRTFGVQGKTASSSESAAGVRGHASATSGKTRGVIGETNSSTDGAQGVYGLATAGSGQTHGVYGRSDSPVGRGVTGLATAESGANIGVLGRTDSSSDSAIGVSGYASARSGLTYGVRGTTESTSVWTTGVYGRALATEGTTFGVRGTTASSTGGATGVKGYASASSGGTIGVHGLSNSATGAGVYGQVGARSGMNYGVLGTTLRSSDWGIGVRGSALATEGRTVGVYGESESEDGRGVWGHTDSDSGTTIGVFGRSDSEDGTGVYGFAPDLDGTTYGVYGVVQSANGYAGYFLGRGYFSEYLSKAGGGFRIDHPADPENQYLNHSFVESPDMMNVYNGNVVLDNRGEAWVQLPDYFETLNREFRYQLTAIGGPGPNLHVAQEVEDNRFKIAGGSAGLKVSWQVTGVRQDAWAEANRPLVEEPKPAGERGYYMHPAAYGLPKDRDVETARAGWMTGELAKGSHGAEVGATGACALSD
jgi:hypothetical protein